MAFRFQKRIKLLPGVTINLSKRGVSTSLGVKGARITKGHGKTRTTLGLPGSGISHTSIATNASAPQPPEQARPPAVAARRKGLAHALGMLVGRLLRR